MNLLVVGDASGAFLINFVKYLKLRDSNISVDVLNNHKKKGSTRIARNTRLFRRVYTFYRGFGFIDCIPKLRGLFREIDQYLEVRKVIRNNKYDVVVLFGLWPISCKFFLRNHLMLPFSIGVIMGSDYLQMDQRPDKESFLATLRHCKRVLVGNPVLLKRLTNDKILEPIKLRNVLFGSEPLELLFNSYNLTREIAKEKLGINQNSIVIVCGYNAHPNQQHLEILNELKKVNWLPAEHLLILPLTYGGDYEYKESIKCALKDSVFNYRILENYLSDEEVIILRRATDVFIQIQKTDSFSGSMQENLFCGNIVVTGSWLPYEAFKERGIKFLSIDQISDLSKTLQIVFSNLIEFQYEFKEINSSDKFSAGLWRNCIEDWYNSIIEFKS